MQGAIFTGRGAKLFSERFKRAYFSGEKLRGSNFGGTLYSCKYGFFELYCLEYGFTNLNVRMMQTLIILTKTKRRRQFLLEVMGKYFRRISFH